ncbi:16S rRNA (cytosine(1402)-N(4))-methyltransferase [Magnetococcales bacterium HHB-1]
MPACPPPRFPDPIPLISKDEPITPLTLINRKPITATHQEITHNPRARSAKLRLAERL